MTLIEYSKDGKTFRDESCVRALARAGMASTGRGPVE